MPFYRDKTMKNGRLFEITDEVLVKKTGLHNAIIELSGLTKLHRFTKVKFVARSNNFKFIRYEILEN